MLPVLDSLECCNPIFHFFPVVGTQDELPTGSDDLEKEHVPCTYEDSQGWQLQKLCMCTCVVTGKILLPDIHIEQNIKAVIMCHCNS